MWRNFIILFKKFMKKSYFMSDIKGHMKRLVHYLIFCIDSVDCYK